MRLDTGPGHMDTGGDQTSGHLDPRGHHTGLAVTRQDLTRDLLRAEDLVRVVINGDLLGVGLGLGRTELRLRRRMTGGWCLGSGQAGAARGLLHLTRRFVTGFVFSFNTRCLRIAFDLFLQFTARTSWTAVGGSLAIVAVR